MDAPLCGCHGEPMRWNKDHRYRAGGFFHCRVVSNTADRARNTRRYEDPFYRIPFNLHKSRQYRAATLTRRREALGEVPQ